ncbi:hypothetical protein [Actinomadura harenae]|nr:hypothetical protein [Actinomadura harenae]
MAEAKPYLIDEPPIPSAREVGFGAAGYDPSDHDAYSVADMDRELFGTKP